LAIFQLPSGLNCSAVAKKAKELPIEGEQLLPRNLK
jgi:hypothetical protein